MTKGLNEQVEEFRNRSLAGTVYPVLWVDALYEKVRVDGRIVSIAVLIVCGVDENGHQDIIAVEPMTEEFKSSYGVLFQNLKDRGLSTPRLIISDAHSGLVSAIRDFFPGASWQRCKVHFMSVHSHSSMLSIGSGCVTHCSSNSVRFVVFFLLAIRVSPLHHDFFDNYHFTGALMACLLPICFCELDYTLSRSSLNIWITTTIAGLRLN